MVDIVVVLLLVVWELTVPLPPPPDIVPWRRICIIRSGDVVGVPGPPCLLLFDDRGGGGGCVVDVVCGTLEEGGGAAIVIFFLSEIVVDWFVVGDGWMILFWFLLGLRDGGVVWTGVTSGSPHPMVMVGHRSIMISDRYVLTITISGKRKQTREDHRDQRFCPLLCLSFSCLRRLLSY